MVYIRANDIVLNIELRGRGEPVTLIADIGEDLTSWCFQSSSFGSLHFLLQLDNRGSGWSDCPDHAYSVELMARDVIGLMDLIGMDTTHVVGLGLGGMIAQELAIQRPRRVGGLVLVSSSAQATLQQKLVYDAWVRAARDHQDHRTISRFMVPWLYSTWFLEHERWREHVIAAKAKNFGWLPWDGVSHQLEALTSYGSKERLDKISSPTLVLSGTEDLLTPSSCAEELVNGITDARLERVNAGHLLQVELPRTFNRVVLGFLAEVEGSPPPQIGPALPSCGCGRPARGV